MGSRPSRHDSITLHHQVGSIEEKGTETTHVCKPTNHINMPKSKSNNINTEQNKDTITKKIDQLEITLDAELKRSFSQLKLSIIALTDTYKMLDNMPEDTFINVIKQLKARCSNACFPGVQGREAHTLLAEYATSIGCFDVLITLFIQETEAERKIKEDVKISDPNLKLKLIVNTLISFSDQQPVTGSALCANKTFLLCLLKYIKLIGLKIESSGTRETGINDWLNALLTVLFNITEVSKNRDTLRYEGFGDLLLWITLHTKLGNEERLIGLLSLANIQTEEDGKRLLADPVSIAYLVNNLKRAVSSSDRSYRGWALSELGRGVEKLAMNDTNKRILVRVKILPVLYTMLQLNISTYQEEVLIAIHIMWEISFLDENKGDIVEYEDLIDKLNEFRDGSSTQLAQEADRALWNLRDELASTGKYQQLAKSLVSTSKVGESDTDQNHVMISYNWEHQDTLLHVRDYLKECGYETWMDVDNMEGSTLQAMADAVENANAVIVGMTEKYKDSQFCRLEFEYAFKCKKLLVPLLLQPEYQPDGWLGLVVGNLLYHDFTKSNTDFYTIMGGVVKALASVAKTTDISKKTQHNTPLIVPKSTPLAHSTPFTAPLRSHVNIKVRDDIISWSRDDIQSWLAKHQVQCQSLLKITGKQIVFLAHLRNSAPESFYSLLRMEFKLRFQQLVDFCEALDAINESSEKNSTMI